MNAPFLPGSIPTHRHFSTRRIGALMLRHIYLLRSSWTRLAELIYWPLVQMVMWGFLQTYLNGQTGFAARAGGTLIGAILLWDILIRGQLGLSVSFLEEMWSRNIANLFISPLRPGEFLIALMAMSLVRLIIGVVPVTLLAIWFFGFNLWSLGLGLGAFFANLLLSAWAVGTIVSGLILRNGMGAENLAWTLMFLIMPVTAVFYPVAVLPPFIQPLALVVAADLRLRRTARHSHRPRFPGRPDGRGVHHQCRLDHRRLRRIPAPRRFGARARIADGGRRIGAILSETQPRTSFPPIILPAAKQPSCRKATEAGKLNDHTIRSCVGGSATHILLQCKKGPGGWRVPLDNALM